ncbi:LysM peptidoglycan-binding domain-containing protein [Pengzhenrongella sicca]|uniref:LysM peptidoglycan-binding domain-containing protein n=1 Tax=Pengzhenrongella sicca TaxID=2819238 RepID=A0A8A4ZFG1_9MICO|nr:LysM peptidoglycan-binding domain-containing protein [Pengzhenrongella sicca]QTE30634.1 LysM peptidoglycan-binding domain-containing protein [Pengzhenrongella sicca]
MSTTLILPTGAQGQAELSLTPRGRRVLRVAGVVLLVLVALLGGRAVAGTPSAPISVDTYTVSAGESLWAIASAYTAPHEDVRDTVTELVDLNGLAGSSVQAGEQILVPAG